MCQQAEKIRRHYWREAAFYSAIGYYNTAMQKQWDMENAIRRHKRDCPVCRYEQEAALVGMRQGREA